MGVIRIGNLTVEADGEFGGFAAASIAQLQAACDVSIGSTMHGHHMQLAAVFAQLETANQLELLRKEGLRASSRSLFSS